MDINKKLHILADAAKYDASCASSGTKRSGKTRALGNSSGIGICHSYTPDGRCVSLLKILLTNYCVYDCKFCINRISSDTPRARLHVDEVVRLVIEFYKRNYIEGLFLSSGIIQSADYTMEQLAEVAKRLRTEEKFLGYIHLKAIPGADPVLVQRAAQFADRLSANIELPSQSDLSSLAPEKKLSSIESTMKGIQGHFTQSKLERKRFKSAPKLVPAGQSTQMIVGASPSSDRIILGKASTLYSKFSLKRVYYSAFSPIQHADPHLPPSAPPLVRENRLYQADWLMRFYHFDVEEIIGKGKESLSLEFDPKLAWALRNQHFFPVDINTAAREELLRVPGLGVRSVHRILKHRRIRRIRYSDLKKLRVVLRKAKAFIRADGYTPTARELQGYLAGIRAPRVSQLGLFDPPLSALSGEL